MSGIVCRIGKIDQITLVSVQSFNQFFLLLLHPLGWILFDNNIIFVTFQIFYQVGIVQFESDLNLLTVKDNHLFKDGAWLYQIGKKLLFWSSFLLFIISLIQ